MNYNNYTKEEKNNKKEESDKNKNKFRYIVVGLMVIVLLTSVIGLNSCHRSSEKQPIIPRPGVGQVDNDTLRKMSDKELKDYIKKKQDASAFTLKYSAAASIEKGSKNLKVYLSNSDKNIIDCYIEILHNNKILYTSAMMKPSQAINSAELLDVLPEGSNKLIARYHLVYQNNELGVIEVEINTICK